VPADRKGECSPIALDTMGATGGKFSDGMDALSRLFDSVTYTDETCTDTGSKGGDAGTNKQTNDKSGNGATAHVASYLSLTVLCFVTMLFL